jgi:5'-3' exonuclease
MGIEKFFSTLSNIKNLWSENKYPHNKVKSSILLIDFNAIVHLTSSRVLKKYNKDSTSDFIEEQILLNIKKFLKHLLNNVLDNKNLKYIYIAIDGVPTFGKMREQIKRRYIGKIISSLSNDTTIWSKGNITPGTKFMSKLNIYLEEIINELKKGLPKIKDIILSGSDQSGEGEMKIIDYLKNIKCFIHQLMMNKKK